MRVSLARVHRAEVVGPGMGSARSKLRGLLHLTEILGAKKLGQACDLGAANCGLRKRPAARARLSSGSVEQCIWIRPTLNESW